MTQDNIDKLVKAAKSTNATAKEIATKNLKEAGLDTDGNEIKSSKEEKEEKEEKSEKKSKSEKGDKASKPREKKESRVYNIEIDGEKLEITAENCERVLNEWNARKAKVKENSDKKKKTSPVVHAVETVKDSIQTITNAVEKIVDAQVDKGITPAQEKTKISELNEIKALLKKLAELLSKFSDKNVNIKSALTTLEESISTIKESE